MPLAAVPAQAACAGPGGPAGGPKSCSSG